MSLYSGTRKNDDGEKVAMFKTKAEIDVINFSRILRIHVSDDSYNDFGITVKDKQSITNIDEVLDDENY